VITVETSDLAYDLQTYTFTLTAIADDSNDFLADTFVLSTKQECWDAVVTLPSFISDPTTGLTVTYELFQAQSIEFNEAIDTTVGTCGAFTYELIYVSNDQEVDTGVYTIDASTAATPLIKAQPTTRDWVSAGFAVYLKATLGNYSSFTSSN